jgi:hypothetical protein
MSLTWGKGKRPSDKALRDNLFDDPEKDAGIYIGALST